MKNLRYLANRLAGRVWLEPARALAGGKLLLHLSDTPSLVYPEIRRLLSLLKPDSVIHTGDLVDNLKLELRPSLIRRYEHELRVLLKIMNDSGASRIIFALGNHDNPDLVRKYAGRVEIYQDGGIAHLAGKVVGFCHYGSEPHQSAGLPDITPAPDWQLYGHDGSLPSHSQNKTVFLNGLEAIHLIDLESGRYLALEYPIGTDTARSMPQHIGI